MTENLYTTNCIRTYSGKYFNPIEPDISLIDITDIAHSLSMQCRFGGHLPVFYSVAQHCVLVAENVPKEYKFCALMHDASEAYLLDFPRPIKDQMLDYKKIEDNLMQVIAARYGFAWPIPKYVKDADIFMLEREWSCLMLNEENNYEPIKVWSQEKARFKFLEMYLKLINNI